MYDFDLRKFLKDALLEAVGKMPDYKIKLNSAGWLQQGVFEESDLAEIKAAIEAQYILHEEE